MQFFRSCLVWLFLAAFSSALAQPPAVPPRPDDDTLVRVLRTTNKAQTNKYVCEAFRFENINPYNVVNFFWAPLFREEGGIYTFVEPGKERGYIVVICPEYQIEMLRRLAAELDRPQMSSAPGSKYIYYRLQHRNIADPFFRATAAFYLGDSGVLIPDVETNSVQIFDAPDGATKMEQAFKEILDKPLPQVEIHVKLYEVDVNNDARIGLDYITWKNGPGALLGQFEAAGEYFNMNNSGHSHNNVRGSGLYLSYPSAFFDFLVTKGRATVLSETRISAINRAPALVATGDQITYLTSDNIGDQTITEETKPLAVAGITFPSDGDGIAGGNVRYPWRDPSIDGSYPVAQFAQQNRPISSRIRTVDTGISLGLVPTIGTDMVNVQLELKVVSQLGYDGSGTPLLGSRQMRDAVALIYGEEVIFGGLTRERRIQETRKMPFLGSLPVIGYLFGGEVSTNQKTMVIAAIEPFLIVDSNNVTEADRATIRRETGEEVVVLPRSEFMFEQSFGRIF